MAVLGKQNKTPSSLTVILWNAHSFQHNNNNSKPTELLNYIKTRSHNVDIICIQETWLQNNKSAPKLNGYQAPIEKRRAQGTRGGVAIYVKEGIQYHEINITDQQNVEACAITVYGINGQFQIYNVYIPEAKHNTKETYDSIFQNVKNNENTLIVGGFNLKHISWNPQGDYRCDGEADVLLELIDDKNLNLNDMDK